MERFWWWICEHDWSVTFRRSVFTTLVLPNFLIIHRKIFQNKNLNYLPESQRYRVKTKNWTVGDSLTEKYRKLEYALRQVKNILLRYLSPTLDFRQEWSSARELLVLFGRIACLVANLSNRRKTAWLFCYNLLITFCLIAKFTQR